VTQRTQTLHNAMLGSCDTMIAHRLTAPADQEPVKKWLKANVSKEIFDKVEASLASLKIGSAWICSAEAQVAELVQFPKISTFDNSATPTGNEASQDVKTARVDQDKLRAIIGDAVKEAESDAPKALRTEITRLKADLAKKPAEAAPVDTREIERKAWVRGKLEGYGEAIKDVSRIFGNVTKQLVPLRQLFEGLEESASRIQGWADRVEERKAELASSSPASSLDVLPRLPSNTPMPPVQPTLGPRPSGPGGGGNLPGPQQRILNSLATWPQMGEHQLNNAQVAWLAGYSPSSTSYTNPRRQPA
jgi:hypothetical protein